MQRKRVHTKTFSAGSSGVSTLVATVDETNGVNFHNVHFGLSAETENADANSHGLWVLWCIPDATSAVPQSDVIGLEAEGSNPFLWAMGTWFASNQTPYNSGDMVIRSSRNCPRDGRLVLVVDIEGATAGNTRIVSYLTYNTKSL